MGPIKKPIYESVSRDEPYNRDSGRDGNTNQNGAIDFFSPRTSVQGTRYKIQGNRRDFFVPATQPLNGASGNRGSRRKQKSRTVANQRTTTYKGRGSLTPRENKRARGKGVGGGGGGGGGREAKHEHPKKKNISENRARKEKTQWWHDKRIGDIRNKVYGQGWVGVCNYNRTSIHPRGAYYCQFTRQLRKIYRRRKRILVAPPKAAERRGLVVTWQMKNAHTLIRWGSVGECVGRRFQVSLHRTPLKSIIPV